jgi:steroid 5-alpha reductase family enzyme
VYDGGLFGLSRHINYFGYTLWRTGYALAAGGWTWGAVTGSILAYDFNFRAIPVLQHYLEENVSCLYRLPKG